MSDDMGTFSSKIKELEVENTSRNDELTKETLEELFLNKKLSSRQIAKMYHIGKSTVLRKLHLFGIETRETKVPPKVNIEKTEIEALYIDQKLSISKIAKKFNVSNMTIHKKLRQAKIQCREVSEANTRIKKYPFDGDNLRKAYLIGFALGDLNVKNPVKTVR